MSSFNTLNKAMIIGRLGQDPELKHTQSGTVVCNFSVATDSSVKKGEGWEDVTTWHRVVVFAKLAETVAKYLKKGSTCFVEGRIQTRKYQDRDGNERSTTEIVAQSVKFMDSKPQQALPEKQKSDPFPLPEKQVDGSPPATDDDNLPF